MPRPPRAPTLKPRVLIRVPRCRHGYGRDTGSRWNSRVPPRTAWRPGFCRPTAPDSGSGRQPPQPYCSLRHGQWAGTVHSPPSVDEGWLYPATVIDIASRRVVGWATADHLRTDLVADALTNACRQHRPINPVISHSDRGCQYTSQQLASLADQLGVRLSVGRTGQCWDNALAESFFPSIKREVLHTTAWPSRATAHTAIFDFIEGWYNVHRLHSSLGHRSPAEYETALAA
ncbi:IS3 family transposase [Streptomyces sp. NPDC005423]|uniref:IS3 family transposase n=1 Tax=Streptomyces sp. NPDC005423 TaxID=3155343 RepID=UPI0033ACDB80